MQHNRTDRVAGLDLLVRALVAAGDLDAAKTALAELSAIATIVATGPIRAAACFAAGTVALGSADADAARRHLEDAADLYLASAAPFELGRARIELARALVALGRIDDGRDEAQRAIDLLSELHAELAVSRARALLESIPKTSAGEPGLPDTRVANAGGLTKREREVLRLVADGLNNQGIADKLFVSEHTIHRHVANIFTKLSVSSRAAAVAQAARRGLL